MYLCIFQITIRYVAPLSLNIERNLRERNGDQFRGSCMDNEQEPHFIKFIYLWAPLLHLATECSY